MKYRSKNPNGRHIDHFDREAERESQALQKQGQYKHSRILRLQTEYKQSIERKAFNVR